MPITAILRLDEDDTPVDTEGLPVTVDGDMRDVERRSAMAVDLPDTVIVQLQAGTLPQRRLAERLVSGESRGNSAERSESTTASSERDSDILNAHQQQQRQMADQRYADDASAVSHVRIQVPFSVAESAIAQHRRLHGGTLTAIWDVESVADVAGTMSGFHVGVYTQQLLLPAGMRRNPLSIQLNGYRARLTFPEIFVVDARRAEAMETIKDYVVNGSDSRFHTPDELIGHLLQRGSTREASAVQSQMKRAINILADLRGRVARGYQTEKMLEHRNLQFQTADSTIFSIRSALNGSRSRSQRLLRRYQQKFGQYS